MPRVFKAAALAVVACFLMPGAAASRPLPPQLPPLSPPYIPPSQAPGLPPTPTVSPGPDRTAQCVHQAGSVPANQRAAYIHRCIYG
jgi:hypothetical protein